MTMPKRINPSQEKLHRVKTRTGDTQSGYLEEKLAGSRYVNIIEEDGASGKRLRIELDGASVSAEISDHKVKVDNADTAEYLENKITAGDNIVLSKETSGGKKNIKVSALVPDVVNLKNVVYFTNEILIQSGVTEVAGKVYNTYANFLAYVSTLPPVSKPSNSNPWVVQLPSGRFDELVTFIEGVSIRGRNTILHTVKSEFTVDFESDFSMESVLANLSYIKDCVVERFDFSNSVLPTVIPIIPIFGCFVTDKNLTQNGSGIVIACGSQFNELNFQEDLSGNALIVAGFNCIFKESVLPPMSSIDHSSLFGCTISGGEYSNCHIAELSDALPSKFGAGNDGRIKLSNCKIEGADFLYSLTTNPYGKRIEVSAENTVFKDSRFFAGEGTPRNSDYFDFINCSFDSCVGESVAGTTGILTLRNCSNAPFIDTPHYGILGRVEGNQIINEFGILQDSNVAIDEIRFNMGFDLKMIEIPYTYLDTVEKFSATFLRTNYVIVECRNIVIEAYDGDYNNKVMVTVQDGSFPEAILDNADSDLFLTGIYSKNVRKKCIGGGGPIWLQFTDTPGATPPTKGNGVIQVFYFEKVKP